MTVTLIDSMGNDSSVVNAARVSFDKLADKFTEQQNKKLIRYLAQHNHWSPFAHCMLSFRITAPIFIARQLAKHQVGFSWNEVSRRYIATTPEAWVPDVWRSTSASAKQGSSNVPAPAQLRCYDIYNKSVTLATQTYNELLERGVCPEQARAVLPQSMMTSWIWTGSLYGFSRVCKLRLAPDTQFETRSIVQSISNSCFNRFPLSWDALGENK